MIFTYQACIIGTRISKLTNNWSAQFVKKLVRDPEKQKKLISKEVYVHCTPTITTPLTLCHPTLFITQQKRTKPHVETYTHIWTLIGSVASDP